MANNFFASDLSASRLFCRGKTYLNCTKDNNPICIFYFLVHKDCVLFFWLNNHVDIKKDLLSLCHGISVIYIYIYGPRKKYIADTVEPSFADLASLRVPRNPNHTFNCEQQVIIDF